jgi:hypothetical protein
MNQPFLLARRIFASPTARSTAGLLLLAALAWQAVAAADARTLPWIALTALAIVAGCIALGWLRPASVSITAPQAMLLLGTLGMVAGLAIDAHEGGFRTLVALCSARDGDFLTTLRLHWRWLPAMHLGMIGGGLATVVLLRTLRRNCRRQLCARLAQNFACSLWMAAGMSAGTMLFAGLAGRLAARNAASMLGGMFAGMVWGMVASVLLYRLWFRTADRKSNAQATASAPY